MLVEYTPRCVLVEYCPEDHLILVLVMQGGCTDGGLVLVIGSFTRSLPSCLLKKVASLPHRRGMPSLRMYATLEAEPGFPEAVQQLGTGRRCSRQPGTDAAYADEDQTLPSTEQNPMGGPIRAGADSSIPRGGQTLQMALEVSPARTEQDQPRAVQGSPAVKPTPFTADLAIDTASLTADTVSVTADPVFLTADLASPAVLLGTLTAQQAHAADSARAATQLVSSVMVANANVQSMNALQELSQQVPANQQQTIHKDQVQVSFCVLCVFFN